MTWALLAQSLAVLAFGAILGATELLSRYRDAPFEILQSAWTWIYVGLNALVALASLALVKTIASGIVPAETNALNHAILEVIIAGFGGAALFRSAIMRSRIGDADVGVGPSFVVETLLSVTDREIDRRRAVVRSQAVAPVMIAVPTGFVFGALVPYCLSLMQNLSADERQTIETKLDSLTTKKMEAEVMAAIAGLMLVNLVGIATLKASVESLDGPIEAARKRLASLPDADELTRIIEGQEDWQTSAEEAAAS